MEEVGAVATSRTSSARAMIQGSNHPRTARSALGQDICGRSPFSSLIFFPRSCLIDRNARLRRTSQLRWLSSLLRHTCSGMTGMIPAEREGAADQLPVPSDGLIASHLILRPAKPRV